MDEPIVEESGLRLTNFWVLIGVLVVILVGIGGIWWYQSRTFAPHPAFGPSETPRAEKHALKLSFKSLKPPGKGHFEAWVTLEGEEISVGKFKVDEEGKLLNLEGTRIEELSFERDLSQAEKVTVTIEPEEDTKEAPSGVVLFEGQIKKDRADLAFKAVDLSQALGQYFLGTPSFSQDKELTSGVWFAKPAGLEFKEQEASLVLPEAPEGFVYEGWVVHRGKFLTVGRFLKPVGDDDFSGFLGLHRYPDFPGEDFLINEPEDLDFEFPIDLTDGESQVVISLEPDIDGEDPTGDGPFQLQFLKADIPKEADIYTLYDLKRDLSGFPTGTAEIR